MRGSPRMSVKSPCMFVFLCVGVDGVVVVLVTGSNYITQTGLAQAGLSIVSLKP